MSETARRKRRNDYMGPRIDRKLRLPPELNAAIEEVAGPGEGNAWIVDVLTRATRRRLAARNGSDDGREERPVAV